MRLVVGLGNPGERYSRTPHNAGFEVVDRVAQRQGLQFQRKKLGLFQWDVGCLAGSKSLGFWLQKPQSFMNRSGGPVSRLTKYFKIGPSDVLLVLDDMALPLGKLRLRPEGSSGGHLGLESVISGLGTKDFARLRVGVDTGGSGDWQELVLRPIPRGRQNEFEAVYEKAADAVELWLKTGDLNQCMNRFNA